MKIWQATGMDASRVPLLQEPLPAEQLPATVLQALDVRLQERAQLESTADVLMARLRPSIESMTAEAVRQELRDAWQQRYPLEDAS